MHVNSDVAVEFAGKTVVCLCWCNPVYNKVAIQLLVYKQSTCIWALIYLVTIILFVVLSNAYTIYSEDSWKCNKAT